MSGDDIDYWVLREREMQHHALDVGHEYVDALEQYLLAGMCSWGDMQRLLELRARAEELLDNTGNWC